MDEECYYILLLLYHYNIIGGGGVCCQCACVCLHTCAHLQTKLSALTRTLANKTVSFNAGTVNLEM